MSQMQFAPRRCFVALATFTLAARVAAGTVSLEESQPPASDAPAAAASSAAPAPARRADGARAGGRSGAEAYDNIDFGDAGKLVRMLDGAEQNRVARGGPAMPAMTAMPPDPRAVMPADSNARGNAAGNAVALPMRPEVIGGDESAGASRQQVIREGGETYNDPSAGHGLVDQASPEQRNAMREIVATIRSVVEHPLTWVVVGVLAVATLAISAAGRRNK